MAGVDLRRLAPMKNQRPGLPLLRSLAIVLLMAGSAVAADRVVAPADVRDLASGRPVGDAPVVLVDSHRPFLAGIFSSADPSRCRAIEFSRTDAAGRLPPPARGGRGQVAFVLAAGVAGPRVRPAVERDGADFVLVAQRLQSSERAEPFGPAFATEAQAAEVRERFLASPEGSDFTAFTTQPYGEQVFRNYRSLRVRWVPVARSAARYPSEAAALAAERASVWTLQGATDLSTLREVMAFCGDATVRGLERIGPLLEAWDRSADAADPGPQGRELREHWRARARR